VSPTEIQAEVRFSPADLRRGGTGAHVADDGGLLVSARQARRPTTCRECAFGRVVTISEFHELWTERFTREEIEAIARSRS